MKRSLYFFCLIVAVTQISCGDILDFKRKISTNYYLSEVDSRRCLSIAFKSPNGSYIERVPTSVIGYSVLGDSLIIAKSKRNEKSTLLYYLICIEKDSDIADSSTFLLVPPFDENEYKSKWESKFNVRFTTVPKQFLNRYR